MVEVGKAYFYQTKGGTIRYSVLMNQTSAWNCFENGDWIERYAPLYDTEEQLMMVNRLVHKIYVSTYVPEVVHIPNRFTKEGVIALPITYR